MPIFYPTGLAVQESEFPRLSVVIPAFRSEKTLPELCNRLAKVLQYASAEYEIIIVEDSGSGQTWQVIQELAAVDDRIRGLLHSRNYGQHNAILSGIRVARFEIIITMDDDLQNPPEEIPALLAKLAEGFDVVYGAPLQEKHGILRNVASRITKRMLENAMGEEVSRHISAFRIFRTHLREAFRDYRNPFISIDVLLTWGTTRFAAIPVRHDARTVGTSGYTLSKLVRHTLNMVTGYSVFPLQLASWTGFLFTLFGIGLLIYIVGRYLFYGSNVAGFPFLASIISIFAGAQMFAIGIMGEYLARMHVNNMGRPSAVIRETTFSLHDPANKEYRESD